MDRFKRFLAVPMAASAVAALWLLYRQTGGEGVVTGLSAIAVMGASLTVIGLRQRGGEGSGLAPLGVIFSFSIMAAALAPGRLETAPRAVAGAELWSEARVNADLKNGRPVFVYFTADWCLTCKVNEAAAIDREEVRAAFRRANVDVLAADWTNGDPAITRFLEARGRAGVPLYLWYAPGKPVEELPQVLTPSMLIARAQAVRR